MKFEDLFTSIDLSSQLYFAGMGDKSIYAYFKNENNGTIIKKNTRVNEKWLAPAYTSEEILLRMPPVLELGDEFYLNHNKYEPKTVEERFYKKGNNNIRLIIERTEDNTEFRFTARYYLAGELGSIGIKINNQIENLYSHSFYLPEAIGKLYLLLAELKLINK